MDIAVSPIGNTFATAATSPSHNSAMVLLWSMKNFEVEVLQRESPTLTNSFQNTLPIDLSTVAINCLCFNHNASLVLTGGSDGMIRLFGTTPIICQLSQSKDTSFCQTVMGWN